MALLSPADLQAIRNAIQGVTDQFFITPVTYRQTKGTNDPWKEDNEKETTIHNLLGLSEYPEGEIQKDKDGANDFFDIKLSFKVADLEASGLWDAINNTVSFVNSASSDRMTVKGVNYKVTFVGYDGPLEDKPVLVILKGEIIARNV